MVVGQGAEEACLGAVVPDFFLLGFAKGGDALVGRVAQELVAEGDVVEQAVVHVRHQQVVGVPGEVGQPGHVVTGQPSVDDLVRAALLHVKVVTHIVPTLIGSEVCFSAALLLSRNGEGDVELAEDGLVVVDRSIDRARGLLDVGQLVEVAHARGGQHCACRQQGEAERMEYLFHHRYLLLR